MNNFHFGAIFGIGLFAIGLNNIMLAISNTLPNAIAGVVMLVVGSLFMIGYGGENE